MNNKKRNIHFDILKNKDILFEAEESNCFISFSDYRLPLKCFKIINIEKKTEEKVKIYCIKCSFSINLPDGLPIQNYIQIFEYFKTPDMEILNKCTTEDQFFDCFPKIEFELSVKNKNYKLIVCGITTFKQEENDTPFFNLSVVHEGFILDILKGEKIKKNGRIHFNIKEEDNDKKDSI